MVKQTIEMKDNLGVFMKNKNLKKISRREIKKTFLLKKRLESFESVGLKNQNYKKILSLQDNYFKLSKNFADNDLLCPICMDYFIEPRATICGHNFCDKCFFESMLKFNFCPICKTSIKKKYFSYSKSFNNLILNYHKFLPLDSKEIYLKRMEEYDEWVKSKKVVKFEIGQKFDILDPKNIWCVGELRKIIKNKKHADTLFFHYSEWSELFDEYICANSERIAPLGFFTARTDIPKYSTNTQSENNLFNYIFWERNPLTRTNHFTQQIRLDINENFLFNTTRNNDPPGNVMWNSLNNTNHIPLRNSEAPWLQTMLRRTNRIYQFERNLRVNSIEEEDEGEEEDENDEEEEANDDYHNEDE